jgi:hypothetical protein
LTADQLYLFCKFIVNLLPCQFDFHHRSPPPSLHPSPLWGEGKGEGIIVSTRIPRLNIQQLKGLVFQGS